MSTLLDRYVALARLAGSSATTARGVRMALARHWPVVAAQKITAPVTGTYDLPIGSDCPDLQLPRWMRGPLHDADLREKTGCKFLRSNKIKNWTVSRATCIASQHGTTTAADCGRYSSRCRYTRYEYYQSYHSMVVIARSGGCAIYAAEGKIRARHLAGKNEKFRRDQYGPMIVRGECEYHPTPAEWGMSPRKFRAAINAGISAIRAGKRQKIEEAKKLRGVAITLHDSVRAGNCVQGTTIAALRAGASREHVEAGYPVPASRFDLTEERVARAASQAYLRETLIAI